jgi:hypothetical protein
MAGFKWTPQYRINGGAAVNMLTTFAYGGGPVLTDVEYVPETQRRLDGNKKVHRLFWGFRPTVTFTFDVGGTMADAGEFSTLVNALVDTTKTVEVSLNSGTATWRVMELVSAKGPDPFQNKTIAGGRFVLKVEAAELIATYPDTGTGDAW